MGKFYGLLLASDLDGTLHNRDHTISPENRDALSYFQSQGGYFTLATGRSPQAMETPLRTLACNAPLILSNGGLIVHHETGAILAEDFMDPVSGRAFCQKAKTAFPDVTLEVHQQDGVWVFDFNEFSRTHLKLVDIKPIHGQLLDQVPDPWRKALFLGPPETLARLLSWAQTQDIQPFSFCFSHPVMLEMQAATVHKGAGVAFVADWLGVAHDNVYCAGDEQNDLPMLTRFHGYAPDNASKEIKAAVSHHLPHCDQHAIAALVQALDKKYA